MSFILDALRKSEHERERGALPGIADTPIVKPPPSKLPWILGALGVLLALNVVVLLVVLPRPARTDEAATPVGRERAGDASTAQRAAAAAPPPPAPGIPGAVPVPPAAARDVRPLTGEAESADGPAASLDVPPVERDPTLDDDGPPVVVVPPRAPAVRTAPLAAAGTERAPSRAAEPARTSGVPAIDDLAPQATAGLPQLAINLHVYSPEPAQRFVMLNGRRYLDGAQLQEGPTLERITPDGVILNHRGLRFLLPRP